MLIILGFSIKLFTIYVSYVCLIFQIVGIGIEDVVFVWLNIICCLIKVKSLGKLNFLINKIPIIEKQCKFNPADSCESGSNNYKNRFCTSVNTAVLKKSQINTHRLNIYLVSCYGFSFQKKKSMKIIFPVGAAYIIHNFILNNLPSFQFKRSF